MELVKFTCVVKDIEPFNLQIQSPQIIDLKSMLICEFSTDSPFLLVILSLQFFSYPAVTVVRASEECKYLRMLGYMDDM